MAFYYKRNNCFWISYKQSGKRIRRALKTSDGYPIRDEKAARFLTNQIENTAENGILPIVRPETSSLAILEEYKNSSINTKTSKTVVNQCNAIKEFIKTANCFMLKDITIDVVKNYLDGRLNRQEIGKNSANHSLAYIKTFLNYAVQRNYISANPVRNMSKYIMDALPPRFLSKREISVVLKSARQETLFPAISTAIYTGMRYGEIQRLKWEDVNIQNETITVVISKSKKFRTIPLHPKLKLILNKNKPPFDLANQRRVFKRIKRNCGLKDIGWHTFRHSFASQLIMSGVDVVTVSKLLGHADISTTQIYAHLSQEHVKESIKKLIF